MFTGGIGLPELIVIFVVFLFLFGPKALPEVARGIAKAIRLFKREVQEIKQDFDVDETIRLEGKVKSAQQREEEQGTQKDSHDFNPQQKRRDWRPKASSAPKDVG